MTTSLTLEQLRMYPTPVSMFLKNHEQIANIKKGCYLKNNFILIVPFGPLRFTVQIKKKMLN